MARLCFGLALALIIGMLVADNDLAGWLWPLSLGAMVASAGLMLVSLWPRAETMVRRLLNLPGVIWLALGGVWLIWVRLLWASPVRMLPPWGIYVVFAVAWPWSVALLLAILTQREAPRRVVLGVGQMAIIGGITLALLEGLLWWASPNLDADLNDRAAFLPRSTATDADGSALMMPPQAPLRRYDWADQRFQYEFMSDSGDLYDLTCLAPPDDPRPLHVVDVAFDADGFRRTVPAGEGADLLVVGDSFTFAGWTNEPYWMGITPRTIAMGVTGSGTLEQALLVEHFAPQIAPRVIVVAYFEGNDLQDVAKFAEAWQAMDAPDQTPSFLEQHQTFRPLRFLSTYAVGLWLLDQSDILGTAVYGDCPYPLEDAYGNQLTFYGPYMAMGAISGETIQAAPLWEQTTDALERIQAAAQAQNAALVLMYIPTKFRAHWPGLQDDLPALAAQTDGLILTDTGFVDDPSQSDAAIIVGWRSHLDDQRDLLQGVAAQAGIPFFDLTPLIRERAAAGQAVFAPDDTHFSNAGHAIVREALRGFLAAEGLSLPPQTD